MGSRGRLGAGVFPSPMTPVGAASSGGGLINAPFTRVNGPADDPYTTAIAGSFASWSVDSVTPIADDTLFNCARQGYTNTGGATSYTDNLYVTRKVRAPAPNAFGATLSPSTYALSENLWSTDTPTGSVTNNSALLSPVPVAKWITPGKLTIGNTIGGSTCPVELTAGHINARSKQEIACVIFSITDGTTTITVTVSAPTISPNAADLTELTCWALPATDISALTAGTGLITVRADLYPWIGAAASVLSSSSATLGYEFASLYFRRDTTLAASPPIAYVKPTGNDGTGVVSTTDLTARGAEFATIAGAINAADTALGGTTGIDNLIIKCDDGTYAWTAPGANRRQKIGRITITRSTASTSASTVIVTGGASVQATNFSAAALDAGMAQARSAICFRDVTIQRSGAQAFFSNFSNFLEVHFESIRLDRNAVSTNFFAGVNIYSYWNGVTIVSSGNNGFGINTTSVHALIRAVGIGHVNNMESLCVVGCVTNNLGTLENATGRQNNRVVAYNIFYNRTATWSYTNENILGLMNSYNIYEYTGTASNHSFCVSNDSAGYSADHVQQHHNTYLGFFNLGRENLHYDEGLTARTNRRMSYIGVIHVAVFHKGDRFLWENSAQADAPTRLGNWAFMYGVNCRDNFSQFMCNGAVNSDNQAQVYVGLNTPLGTRWNNSSQSVRLDPVFVNYQGTIGLATPGTGTGDYRLQATSPCKNTITSPIRPWTLDGVAVGATDSIGAMSAL